MLDDKDQAAFGKAFAVISPDTKGRIALMNGVGHLQPGTHVHGLAEEGSEALRVLTVEAE